MLIQKATSILGIIKWLLPAMDISFKTRQLVADDIAGGFFANEGGGFGSWTKEGKDINKVSRRTILVDELYEFTIDIRRLPGL